MSASASPAPLPAGPLGPLALATRTFTAPPAAVARPVAVVVGLASVTGLQTARILSARGVPVVGIAGDRDHFAGRTRVCQQILYADVHSAGFLAVLRELGETLEQPAVLFPCTDRAVLVVSAHREMLSRWYRMVLPADHVVQTLMDKATFHEYAQAQGLPVPMSFPLVDRMGAEHAARLLPYPSVLKPAAKSPDWKRSTGIKALVTHSPEELLAAYDRLAPFTETLVAQQYIGGGDDQLFTCNTYYGTNGRLLVSFATRKRRQWPPHVGTASYAEETDDPEVGALARRLFDGVAYRGLGYLEIKREPATGRTYIVEANIGRPTGRAATAEAAGVELLLTMYCDAVGVALHTDREQHFTGASWMDIRRDLLSAFYYARRGELSLADWLTQVRRCRAHAVFSWTDPVPFLFEIGQSSRKAAGRKLRRLTRRGTPRLGRGPLGRRRRPS